MGGDEFDKIMSDRLESGDFVRKEVKKSRCAHPCLLIE